jgi:NAD-dependent DNA ligase
VEQEPIKVEIKRVETNNTESQKVELKKLEPVKVEPTKLEPLKIMLQGDASSEHYKSIITNLGGQIISEISDHFDVLVASELKRSPKLLQAFNINAQIVTVKWLEESQK